jgi:hypothetical protein
MSKVNRIKSNNLSYLIIIILSLKGINCIEYLKISRGIHNYSFINIILTKFIITYANIFKCIIIKILLALNSECKNCTLLSVLWNRNISIHFLNKFLADCESQSDTTLVNSIFNSKFSKEFKQFLIFNLLNAYASIRNLKS